MTDQVHSLTPGDSFARQPGPIGIETFDPFGETTEITMAALYSGACGGGTTNNFCFPIGTF
jgi:hypothetical protein